MATLEQPLILLAEDDEDDVLMIRRALTKANITLPVHAVPDGAEAITYLNGDGIYGTPSFPIPALILLDLNMPRVDGFEVLRWLHGQPALVSIPVVVLTSSSDPSNANKAYDLGASSFLAKSVDFQDAARLMLLLVAQWLPSRVHRRVTAPPVAPPVHPNRLRFIGLQNPPRTRAKHLSALPSLENWRADRKRLQFPAEGLQSVVEHFRCGSDHLQRELKASKCDTAVFKQESELLSQELEALNRRSKDLKQDFADLARRTQALNLLVAASNRRS
jgi:CheY-like chemotaxis protein